MKFIQVLFIFIGSLILVWAVSTYIAGNFNTPYENFEELKNDPERYEEFQRNLYPEEYVVESLEKIFGFDDTVLLVTNDFGQGSTTFLSFRYDYELTKGDVAMIMNYLTKHAETDYYRILSGNEFGSCSYQIERSYFDSYYDIFDQYEVSNDYTQRLLREYMEGLKTKGSCGPK